MRRSRTQLALTVSAFGFAACGDGGVDKSTGISGSGLRFTEVSAGGYFACALATSGAAYCWGDNSRGQLGIGTDEVRRTPTPVEGGLRFKAVSATALRHTCALTTAGAAYCWGENDAGQLGVEGRGVWGRPSPLAVSGGHAFATITTGGLGHTCALTASGAAYCWGRNGYGELGDGSTTDSAVPVAVAGGHVFVSVSASGANTCAITSGGTAYCWGLNDGRLGIGAATGPSECSFNPCSPIPVAVAGGIAFSSISTSGGHTCGVATAGATYCWGANDAGQLGDGTTTNRVAPVRVASGTPFVTVRAGSDGQGDGHTCALAVDGAAHCWGRNGMGQLGDGTTADRTSPVRASGGLTFGALSAGENLTCGLTTAGLVYCWGSNSNGALGSGSMEQSSPVPVRVAGQS